MPITIIATVRVAIMDQVAMATVMAITVPLAAVATLRKVNPVLQIAMAGPMGHHPTWPITLLRH